MANRTSNPRRKKAVTDMIRKGTDPVQDPLNRLEMIRLQAFFSKDRYKIRKVK